jgi:hypothetical protein
MKTLMLEYRADEPIATPIMRLRAWLAEAEAPDEVASDIEQRAARTLTIMDKQAATLGGVSASMNLKQTIEVAPFRVVLRSTSGPQGFWRRILGRLTNHC